MVEGGAVILEIQTAHLASLLAALQGLEANELGQVRLQGQDHTALGGVEGEVLAKRADAVAGGDDVAVGSGVLDVAVLHVGGKHLPGLHDVLAALHEVGGVEDGLQTGDGLVDGQASGGVFAVDALLVLVAGDHAPLVAEITEDVQTAADLLKVGVLAVCAVEGEEADALGLEDLGHIQQVIELGNIVIKISADLGLARGGANGPDLDTRGIQLGFELQGGLAGEVGDVGAVHAADLQVGDVVLGQGLDLTQAARVGLVGKSAELDMRHRIHGASLCLQIEGRWRFCGSRLAKFPPLTAQIIA